MNDMSHPDRQLPPAPIAPTMPLACTLEAQEWNVIFNALNEMPMRIARPVHDKIMMQLQAQTG